MQLQTEAIGVIVWRDEVDIRVRLKKSDQPGKLLRKVKIIIFREIDDFCVLLFQQDVDLGFESSLVPDTVQVYEDEVFRCEILKK